MNTPNLTAYANLDGSEVHLFDTSVSPGHHVLTLCADGTVLRDLEYLRISMLWRPATPKEQREVNQVYNELNNNESLR